MSNSADALHEKILATVATWSEAHRVDWHERAAMLEYDRGNPRHTAEQIAFWQLRREFQAKGETP